MLTRAAEKGMDVYTVWLGPYPMVFVQKPEDVQVRNWLETIRRFTSQMFKTSFMMIGYLEYKSNPILAGSLDQPYFIVVQLMNYLCNLVSENIYSMTQEIMFNLSQLLELVGKFERKNNIFVI